MVRYIILLTTYILLATSSVMAGEKPNFLTRQCVTDRKWFNHIDIAATAGTSGIGFDVALPMTEWAQLRLGGVWMPYTKFDPAFGVEVAEDLPKEIQGNRFQQISDMMENMLGTRPELSVKMEGDAHMSNFKCLVDIFPIKKNRNFHVTVGFYYGNTDFITGSVSPYSMRNLTAIGALNTLYRKALANEQIINLSELGIPGAEDLKFSEANAKLRTWGEKTGPGSTVTNWDDLKQAEVVNKVYAENAFNVTIGEYSHDIVAKEDIYYDYTVELDEPYNVCIGEDKNGNPIYREVRYQTDNNGRSIVKGGIRYHKGEIVHRSGDPIRMVPDENNQLSVEGKGWWKFKPYVGVGYAVPITKDRRTMLGIDAGVTIWGGTPAVNVKVPMGQNANGAAIYDTIDLVRDAQGMPGSVDKYISLVKLLPVMPEISIRISQRLW